MSIDWRTDFAVEAGSRRSTDGQRGVEVIYRNVPAGIYIGPQAIAIPLLPSEDILLCTEDICEFKQNSCNARLAWTTFDLWILSYDTWNQSSAVLALLDLSKLGFVSVGFLEVRCVLIFLSNTTRCRFSPTLIA